MGHSFKIRKDLKIFQKDLIVYIYEWASRNMEFYSNKFECMRYGEEKFPEIKQLNHHGVPIETKGHVKDLGVHMNRDCTFGFHIRNAVVESRNLC